MDIVDKNTSSVVQNNANISKEDVRNVGSGTSNNGDFHANQFISQIMLGAEHPDMVPKALGVSPLIQPLEIGPVIDTETGVIIDFDSEISDLENSKPTTIREYTILLDNLKDNLRQIGELEQNLIRRHMTSGKYMASLQDWFERNFDSHYRWSNFINYVLNKVGLPHYNIRTAQRDMMLYRNLGAYEELLVNAGNTGLAISTIYLLANPDQVSDFALDWSLGLIQDQVNNVNGKAKEVDRIADSNSTSSPFSPSSIQSPAYKSILPETATNFSNPQYGSYSRINNTKQQLTFNHVKKIADTASAIENDIPDPEKRAVIKDIARRHQVVNPELVRELAKQDSETLDEIRATGHIEYPVEVDKVVVQRNVPVSQASTTDLMMMRGEIDDEKHKRHLQHRIDNAREKELLTKGIVSEKVDTVDMKSIEESQHARIAAFIQQNPDLQEVLLPLMNTIRTAQGSAGVRVVVCRLDYAESAQSLKNEYKN